MCQADRAAPHALRHSALAGSFGRRFVLHSAQLRLWHLLRIYSARGRKPTTCVAKGSSTASQLTRALPSAAARCVAAQWRRRRQERHGCQGPRQDKTSRRGRLKVVCKANFAITFAATSPAVTETATGTGNRKKKRRRNLSDARWSANCFASSELYTQASAWIRYAALATAMSDSASAAARAFTRAPALPSPSPGPGTCQHTV